MRPQAPNPCIPDPLPLADLDWKPLVPYIGEARAALAHFGGVLEGMVNPDLLLAPLLTQEAVLSSKIEGTVATLQEVLRFEASDEAAPEERQNFQEVLNYRQAMSQAVGSLDGQGLSLQMIRAIHSVLMSGVRGQNMSPGMFRVTQNHIGKPNCPIDEARFVPPPPTQVPPLLEEWQEYLSSDDLDPLVQLAIAYAQFEIIHPFMDGNGRVGRMLITLFLYAKGLLPRPVFYVSAYLDRHSEENNDGLLSVTREGAWGSWIKFFLTAIAEQAKENSEKAKRVLALYDEMKGKIGEATHSQYAVNALDAIFRQPIFSTTRFIAESGITKQNAGRILAQMQGAGILSQVRAGRGTRPSIYAFWTLVKLSEA